MATAAPRQTAPGLIALGLTAIALTALACVDTSLAINHDDTPGQICEGDFVTGEPFVLCRRKSDGALGAFEVFIEQLVVRSNGDVVFADRFVVGYAELTQTFDEYDDHSLIYWQLKATDNTLLSLQELDGIPAIVSSAASDAETAQALDFIRFFVRHYFTNFNDDLANENGKVYGTDHFIQCLGEAPDSREALCYLLYDLVPSTGDGALTSNDYKALVDILEGPAVADDVGNVDFSIEQYFACAEEDFNTNDDQPITLNCALFDTNGSGTVDILDLTRLLNGDAPDNYPPVAFAGSDISAAGGELVSLNGRGSYDVESEQLDYLWEQVGGTPVGLQATTSADVTFVVPTAVTSGELKFRLTVLDDDGALDTDTVTVTVSGAGGAGVEPDDAPPAAPEVVANAGEDRQISGSELVTLDGSGSSGNSLTFAWSQLTGPAVTLSSLTTMKPVFTAPTSNSPTVLRFQLRITDLAGTTDSDIVDLTLLPSEEEAGG